MTSPLDPQEWHAQFQRQAVWTRPTREFLGRKTGLRRARRILDVGCGSGVVTEEMAEAAHGRVFGLDISPGLLALRPGRPRARYVAGDAFHLPFLDAAFDIVTTHFVLMWLPDPATAMREMRRVVRPGGWVLAFAEPDYGGRMDWPDLPIGGWQSEALRREGAEPEMGRRLRALFGKAGLRAEVTLISAPWEPASLREAFEGEWGLLERTVAEFVSREEMERVRGADLAALDSGARFVFLPVFCAAAQVP